MYDITQSYNDRNIVPNVGDIIISAGKHIGISAVVAWTRDGEVTNYTLYTNANVVSWFMLIQQL